MRAIVRCAAVGRNLTYSDNSVRVTEALSTIADRALGAAIRFLLRRAALVRATVALHEHAAGGERNAPPFVGLDATTPQWAGHDSEHRPPVEGEAAGFESTNRVRIDLHGLTGLEGLPVQ